MKKTTAFFIRLDVTGLFDMSCWVEIQGLLQDVTLIAILAIKTGYLGRALHEIQVLTICKAGLLYNANTLLR